MGKSTIMQSEIVKLAITLRRASPRLGIAAVTSGRRRELVGLIKVQPGFIVAAIEAAKARPDLVGAGVDVGEIQADLAFVAEVGPLVGGIEDFARAIGDEVLVRKARAAQAAVAIHLSFDAAGHTAEAESVAPLFENLSRMRRRPKSAKAAKAAKSKGAKAKPEPASPEGQPA